MTAPTVTTSAADDQPTVLDTDPCPGHPAGPHDHLGVEEVLAQLVQTPGWRTLDLGAAPGRRLRGARRVLDWLASCPGQGWQQRWLTARADHGLGWIEQLSLGDPRTAIGNRNEVCAGVNWLFLARVLRPGYDFFTHYKTYVVFEVAPQIISPALFTRIGDTTAAAAPTPAQLTIARRALVKIALHTGKDLEQLGPENLLEARAWALCSGGKIKNLHLAWDLLVQAGVLNEGSSLRAAVRLGQRPVTELVDSYRIRSRAVRDVLVRYFEERRPSLDYNTLRTLIAIVAGRFWADVEHHHPGIDSLHLPHKVALAWKQRLLHVERPDGTTYPRQSYFEILTRVRAFYLDIQEWAHTDPSWVAFAVPSPVRRGDTYGVVKARQQTTARMHQRTRERLPQLPVLVETAARHRAEQADLLAAASAARAGDTFTHNDITYRRVIGKEQARGDRYRGTNVLAETTTGERIDLTRAEDDAFWSWAIIETLRHTGVRLEELLEITHLALVSYRLPNTGEVVPLLQIVPSKSNEERLLLVSPELASVLATIITRLRRLGGGAVSLVARYDQHERVTGPALPHLFQRRTCGHPPQVISYTTVRKLLNDTVARTGLRDAAGARLHYTAHDFRRIFTTEAVTGGLPIHIAARLLGHHSLNTTQAYHAVFHDELIRAYRGFLETRRATRPPAEYREPTDAEWREFEQHFELRKLELGTCARPYGTPCQHEHACIRCPMLRVDPKQRPRLSEIIHNLTDRITEAQANSWLGEVQGLHISLQAAKKKLAQLDRANTTLHSGPTDLGMPLPTPTPPSSSTDPHRSPSRTPEFS
jgi:integrase